MPEGAFSLAELTDRLAQEYSAIVGVFLHRFGADQHSHLLRSSGVSEDLKRLFEQHGSDNPWKFALSKLSTGDFILGREIVPFHKVPDISPVFYRKVMEPSEMGAGMGAILYRSEHDRSGKVVNVGPDLVIAIAVLRRNGDGIFSAEEVAEFKAIIPILLNAAAGDDLLKAALQREQAG